MLRAPKKLVLVLDHGLIIVQVIFTRLKSSSFIHETNVVDRSKKSGSPGLEHVIAGPVNALT